MSKQSQNRKSQIVNRNQFVFESVLDVVSKQNQNVKTEIPPKNTGEVQPTGRPKLCTHAHNLALGSTYPPEQQACTTTFRPREVVGPPMEVVARLTLTPRDYTGNKLQPHSRGCLPEPIFTYFRFGSQAGKQRPDNVGAVVVVRLLAIYAGSVRLCCRASCGLCAVYGLSLIHI